MEPVFVNKYSHTKESFIEMNKKHSEFMRIFFGLLFFIAFLALSLFGYFVLYDLTYTIVVAVFGVLFAFYPLIRIYILAGKREKQLLELYGTIPEAETLFFDDRIEAVSLTNKAEVKLEYEKIKKIKQSKNMYLLILNKSLVVMVNKNGFEKGTCEEFEEFIKSKAVNAKIRL